MDGNKKYTGTRDEGASKAGRHAAGKDPAKRDQILAGAHNVFSRMGFDAASMNDITREANVSKGTIYVYFQNKEDLFEALIDRERQVLFGDVHSALEGEGTIDEKLHLFGATITRLITCDAVIRAQRIVIGVSERKPALGATFYERGPMRGKALLATFLKAQVDAGRLEIDDIEMASYQFSELCMAGLFRPRIFGHLKEVPSKATVERNVASAVRVFMKAYAPESNGAAGNAGAPD